MRNKVLCVLLAAALLFGILPLSPIRVRAASDMKASQEFVDVLKQWEGFSSTPYKDSSQYTMGYGTRCPDDLVEYYTQNPLTEEQAEVFLKEYLDAYGAEVNAFIDRHGLTYTQGQFDAVLSLIYNIGPNWLKTGENLVEALSTETDVNKVIYALTIYSTSGGVRSVGHIRRRLAEANMYLNGVYSCTPPDNFSYVLFDPCGGTISAKGGTYGIQGYHVDIAAQIVATAVCEGSTFRGWFTEPAGGTQVTVLDASTREMTLYAQWEANASDEETAAPDTTESTAAPAEPSETTSAPETVPTQPTEPSVPAGDAIELEIVDVTGDYVNVRSGPGTSYASVDMVVCGDRLRITAVCENQGRLWGEFELGWVCLEFTSYGKAAEAPDVGQEPTEPEPTEPEPTEPEPTEPEPTEPEPTEPEPTEPEATEPEPTEPEPTEPEPTEPEPTEPEPTEPEPTEPKPTEPKPTEPAPTEPAPTEPEEVLTQERVYATVVKTNTLIVRDAPYGEVVGKLFYGDRIEILDQKSLLGRPWGRTELGWISLQSYVELETVKEEAQTPDTGAEGSRTYATVVKTNTLNVRRDPNGEVVCQLYKGDRIEILEQQTLNGTLWGKTDLGWICLNHYIYLENVTADSTCEPMGSAANGKCYATIVNTDTLSIRSAPDGAVVGKLYYGDRVEILEQRMVNGSLWGRTYQGWLCMNTYIHTETVKNSEPAATAKKTVTASCLNLRDAAGIGSTVVGQLYRGAVIEIQEEKVINGVLWGRVGEVWICLNYVS